MQLYYLTGCELLNGVIIIIRVTGNVTIVLAVLHLLFCQYDNNNN